MKPEAQRIAIAEACGWSRTEDRAWNLWHKDHDVQHLDALPDYLGDLNAIHEAEKTLTRVQRAKFVTELCGLAGVKWKPTSHFDTIHATAAQRAEAFLRTIGKWEDDK